MDLAATGLPVGVPERVAPTEDVPDAVGVITSPLGCLVAVYMVEGVVVGMVAGSLEGLAVPDTDVEGDLEEGPDGEGRDVLLPLMVPLMVPLVVVVMVAGEP